MSIYSNVMFPVSPVGTHIAWAMCASPIAIRYLGCTIPVRSPEIGIRTIITNPLGESAGPASVAVYPNGVLPPRIAANQGTAQFTAFTFSQDRLGIQLIPEHFRCVGSSAIDLQWLHLASNRVDPDFIADAGAIPEDTDDAQIHFLFIGGTLTHKQVITGEA